MALFTWVSNADPFCMQSEIMLPAKIVFFGHTEDLTAQEVQTMRDVGCVMQAGTVAVDIAAFPFRLAEYELDADPSNDHD